MPEIINISWDDLEKRIVNKVGTFYSHRDPPHCYRIWGIPRGGAMVVGIARKHAWVEAVATPEEADVIIDDIWDSGATAERYEKRYGKPVIAMVHKKDENLMGKWIVMPWEEPVEKDLEDNVRRILQGIGEDPSREGLRETPKRVIKAYKELFMGYDESQDAKYILKWFESKNDEMVIVRDIDFVSMCEHHMLPYFGLIDVAYIPNGKVVGLSKIPRLVRIKAARLTIQENLTQEIAEALEQGDGKKKLLGVGVSVRSHHMCMMGRGVRQSGAYMETNKLSGLLKSEAAARAEFLQGVKHGTGT